MKHARSLALLTSLATLVACPSSTPKGPGRPPVRAPGGPFPALELAPATTSLFLGLRHATTAADWLRNFLEPLRIVDQRLTVERTEQDLRRELGVSPLDAAEIEEAGFDGNGDWAVFAVDGSPTVALKIGDDQRLTKFLAERTKQITTYMKPHRGQAVTSWVAGPGVRGSFLRYRGYLLVHLEQQPPPLPGAPPPIAGERAAGAASDNASPAAAGATGKELPTNLRWLDEIIDGAESGKSAATAEGPRWALGVAGEQRDGLLYVDVPRVNRAHAALVAGRAATCALLDADLAGVQRVAAGLRLRKRSAQASVALDLTPGARQALAAKVMPLPGLPAAIWDKAPLRGEWRVAPDWMASLLQRLGRRECGAVQRFLADLSWLGDPARRHQQLLQHSGGALAAALLSIEEKGQGTLAVRGAVVARCSGAPARSYFARVLPPAPDGREEIAGRAVHAVATTTTMTQKVRVSYADDLLRLTAGDDLLPALFKPAVARPAERLLTLQLEPGRVSDLRAALKLAEDQPVAANPFGYGRRPGEDMDQLANFISSYKRLRLDARLGPSGVLLEAEYELR